MIFPLLQVNNYSKVATKTKYLNTSSVYLVIMGEEKKIQALICGLDVTRKDIIEIEVPKKKRRLVLTITKRHYLDREKKKIITDQILHKAVYGRKQNDRG